MWVTIHAFPPQAILGREVKLEKNGIEMEPNITHSPDKFVKLQPC